MIFADLDFYKTEYLAGDTQIIPDDSFIRRAREASVEIIDRTFGRAEQLGTIPERLKHCTCALAEVLFADAEANSNEVYQSESVGEWSGSKRDQRKKEDELNLQIQSIVEKWCRPLSLDGVPLLYSGV